MKIGLLFGSFDPIHNGHMAIAHWALDSGGCDEVWLVLSPQNPMKPTVASPYEKRKAMVTLAVEDEKKIKLSTVESDLEPPYYTILTIEELQKRDPDVEFVVLCGTDVKVQSGHWFRANELHKMVAFVEYPRYNNDRLPFIDVSSTEIRQGLKLDYLNPKVREYIERKQIYNSALERGRALYAAGDICGAINEWSHCDGTEQQKQEAATLRELASEILAYRYTDIYNP